MCGISYFNKISDSIYNLNNVLIKIGNIVPNIIKIFTDNMPTDRVEICEFYYHIREKLITIFLLNKYNIKYNNEDTLETLLILLKRKLIDLYGSSSFNSFFTLKTDVNNKLHIIKNTPIDIYHLCLTSLNFNCMALITLNIFMKEHEESPHEEISHKETSHEEISHKETSHKETTHKETPREDKQEYDNVQKTQMCREFIKTGYCEFQKHCRFIHEKDHKLSELPKDKYINYNYKSTNKRKHEDLDNTKYKTILCRHFVRLGYCELGNDCKFAHEMGELRKIICKNGLNCNYPKCKFDHPERIKRSKYY